jgi:hypothetical protein
MITTAPKPQLGLCHLNAAIARIFEDLSVPQKVNTIPNTKPTITKAARTANVGSGKPRPFSGEKRFA